MAILYKPNQGREYSFPEPKNGTDYQLEELKEAIGGGYIEICQLNLFPDSVMVIDEDGKNKGLPFNEMATAIYNRLPRDCIVGDALVCKRSQIL